MYVLLKNQRIQAHLEKYIDFLKQNDSYFHIGYDNKPNFGVPKSYFTHYVNPALMISMTLGLLLENFSIFDIVNAEVDIFTKTRK